MSLEPIRVFGPAAAHAVPVEQAEQPGRAVAAPGAEDRGDRRDRTRPPAGRRRARRPNRPGSPGPDGRARARRPRPSARAPPGAGRRVRAGRRPPDRRGDDGDGVTLPHRCNSRTSGGATGRPAARWLAHPPNGVTLTCRMRLPPHILVVNGIKVRRPVFLLGAPHSGADLLARALKRVARLSRDHGPAPAWPMWSTPSPASRRSARTSAAPSACCATRWPSRGRCCRRLVRPVPPSRAGRPAASTSHGPCVATGEVTRFGDASPDLLYSAPVLLRAFPDARFVQLIRDGRDVTADMLDDPACLAWFKPVMLPEDTEFPNPFLGVNRDEHRDRWKAMPAAGKSALRWRSAVRLSASAAQGAARRPAPHPALRGPGAAARPAGGRALTEFLETAGLQDRPVRPARPRGRAPGAPGCGPRTSSWWRRWPGRSSPGWAI